VEEFVDKSTDPGTEIRSIKKNNDELQKIGLHLNTYKKKWKRSMKKCEEE
jgi:hypothetical protein